MAFGMGLDKRDVGAVRKLYFLFFGRLFSRVGQRLSTRKSFLPFYFKLVKLWCWIHTVCFKMDEGVLII